MTTSTATNRNIASKEIAQPYMPSAQSIPYARPSDWLTLPTVSTTDQTFAGLLAVFDDDNNYVAFSASTSAGTYTVDWGDGSSTETYATNAIASHKYDYAVISDDTISTLGYKQVIITVTPTTDNLTGINLQQKYVTSPVLVLPPTNWLDIIVGSPYLNNLTISGGAGNTTNLPLLEQLTWMSKLGTFTGSSQMFRNCWGLKNVVFEPTTITNLNVGSFMFGQCYSLKSAPYFETSSFTTMDGMFNLCAGLVYVPPYNTQNVTNMTNMFQGCSSLKSIPTFNTIKVTNMTNTFDGCRSLVHIPNFNTSNVTTMSATFLNCESLESLPVLDTSKLVTAYNTFGGCSSLEVFPAWDFDTVTNTAALFSGCSSLNSVANLNVSNVINMQTMFLGCSSLQQIPDLDTSKSTNCFGMFGNCYSLTSAPDFNTANCINVATMFANCTSLGTAPNLNTYHSSNSASLFAGCSSLSGDITIQIDTGYTCNIASLVTNCPGVDTLTVTGGGTISAFNTLTTSARSLRSVTIEPSISPTVIGAANAFASANSLSSLNMAGKTSFSIASCMFGKNGIENVFGDLIANATSQTITISSNPGADTVRTITAGTWANNSSTITFAGAPANVAVGMVAYGTNVSGTWRTCTVTAGTNNITVTGINIKGEAAISFNTTSNGINQYQVYYVIGDPGTTYAGTFQISATKGGTTPVTITSNGSKECQWEKIVTDITGNVVTVNNSLPAAGTSGSVSFRYLNTYLATLKNWTVTG